MNVQLICAGLWAIYITGFAIFFIPLSSYLEKEDAPFALALSIMWPLVLIYLLAHRR